MKLGEALRHRRNTCLACGALLNAVTAVNADTTQPEYGDPSVCLKCGHVMVFGRRGKLRDPTPEEQEGLSANFDVQSALLVISQLKPKQ
jgi:hypothetical protein